MIIQTAFNIAETILKQIFATTDLNVILSWGINPQKIKSVTHNGNYGLYIHVNGFNHRGGVTIMLDKCTDSYYIIINDKVVRTDLSADMLGAVLDDLIEKPINMTEEEYREKVNNEYKFMKL